MFVYPGEHDISTLDYKRKTTFILNEVRLDQIRRYFTVISLNLSMLFLLMIIWLLDMYQFTPNPIGTLPIVISLHSKPFKI